MLPYSVAKCSRRCLLTLVAVLVYASDPSYRLVHCDHSSIRRTYILESTDKHLGRLGYIGHVGMRKVEERTRSRMVQGRVLHMYQRHG
ncbi:hypothetical protein FPV67DRAFT_1166154 [Lyophyllum atratum]|nr:hypothetical protein FPV67DRAFT_1166154 [Lyophyllum atratum]